MLGLSGCKDFTGRLQSMGSQSAGHDWTTKHGSVMCRTFSRNKVSERTGAKFFIRVCHSIVSNTLQFPWTVAR